MPDDLTGITLRTPTEENLPTFLAPLAIAFGEEYTAPEIENERQVTELDRLFGAFDGDAPVGMAGAFTFRMTTPGGEVGAAGITQVGVMPTHRRRGILRLMMTRLFEQARERGEPVAILWASEAAIYQRFGYGPATLQTEIEAPTDKIVFARPVESKGRVRIVDRDEAADRFPPIFEARRTTIAGSLTRTDAKWRYQLVHDADWMRRGNGPKVRALLEVDGEARAYVIYRINADWDSRGPKSIVTVFELIGVDAASEQALWQWVFSIDLVGIVRTWRGPTPHPLQLMITEPRRLAATVSDAMWLRIIELPAALEGRSYRGPGSLGLRGDRRLLPLERRHVAADGQGGRQPGQGHRRPRRAGPLDGHPRPGGGLPRGVQLCPACRRGPSAGVPPGRVSCRRRVVHDGVGPLELDDVLSRLGDGHSGAICPIDDLQRSR